MRPRSHTRPCRISGKASALISWWSRAISRTVGGGASSSTRSTCSTRWTFHWCGAGQSRHPVYVAGAVHADLRRVGARLRDHGPSIRSGTAVVGLNSVRPWRQQQGALETRSSLPPLEARADATSERYASWCATTISRRPVASRTEAAPPQPGRGSPAAGGRRCRTRPGRPCSSGCHRRAPGVRGARAASGAARSCWRPRQGSAGCGPIARARHWAQRDRERRRDAHRCHVRMGHGHSSSSRATLVLPALRPSSLRERTR